MKSGKLNRLLLFVLALALVVSSFSMVVFAEDAGDQGDENANTEEVVVEEPGEGDDADDDDDKEVGTETTEDEEKAGLTATVFGLLDPVIEQFTLGDGLVAPAAAEVSKMTAVDGQSTPKQLFTDGPNGDVDATSVNPSYTDLPGYGIYPALDETGGDTITITVPGIGTGNVEKFGATSNLITNFTDTAEDTIEVTLGATSNFVTGITRDTEGLVVDGEFVIFFYPSDTIDIKVNGNGTVNLVNYDSTDNAKLPVTNSFFGVTEYDTMLALEFEPDAGYVVSKFTVNGADADPTDLTSLQSEDWYVLNGSDTEAKYFEVEVTFDELFSDVKDGGNRPLYNEAYTTSDGEDVYGIYPSVTTSNTVSFKVAGLTGIDTLTSTATALLSTPNVNTTTGVITLEFDADLTKYTQGTVRENLYITVKTVSGDYKVYFWPSATLNVSVQNFAAGEYYLITENYKNNETADSGNLARNALGAHEYDSETVIEVKPGANRVVTFTVNGTSVVNELVDNKYTDDLGAGYYNIVISYADPTPVDNLLSDVKDGGNRPLYNEAYTTSGGEDVYGIYPSVTTSNTVSFKVAGLTGIDTLTSTATALLSTPNVNTTTGVITLEFDADLTKYTQGTVRENLYITVKTVSGDYKVYFWPSATLNVSVQNFAAGEYYLITENYKNNETADSGNLARNALGAHEYDSETVIEVKPGANRVVTFTVNGTSVVNELVDNKYTDDLGAGYYNIVISYADPTPVDNLLSDVKDGGNRPLYNEAYTTSGGEDVYGIYPSVTTSNTVSFKVAGLTGIDTLTSTATALLSTPNVNTTTGVITLEFDADLTKYTQGTVRENLYITVKTVSGDYKVYFWPSATLNVSVQNFAAGEYYLITENYKNNETADSGNLARNALGAHEYDSETVIEVKPGANRVVTFTVNGTSVVNELVDNKYTDDLGAGYYNIVISYADPTPVTPPTSGGGSSSKGGNGGSSGGGGGGGTGFAVSSSTPAGTPVSASDATSAINAAVSAAKTAGGSTATAKFTNAGNIPASALASIVSAAQAADLTPAVQADTTVGGAVVLRMTFNPTGVTGDVNLGGAVSGTQVNNILNLFKNNFTNKFAVVALNHTGAYGAPVRMAVKLDLTGMNTENLVLYSYNTQANTYTRIEEPNYRIDANGYLWFTTTQGGAVVVSEGPITK